MKTILKIGEDADKSVIVSHGVDAFLCVVCLHSAVEGDYRVVRTCATGGRPDDGCVARAGTRNIKLWYCECRGDGCNTALPSLSPVSNLLLLVITALLCVVSLS